MCFYDIPPRRIVLSTKAMKDQKNPTEQAADQTEKIDILLNEFRLRQQRNTLNRRRMWAWSAMVRFSYMLKRLMDIVGATLALVILSPVLAVVALLVKATSPGPILFTQTRVGKYGRNFRFFKFRSMYEDAERRKKELLSQNESADGVIFKMKHDPRVTPVGRFIRKYSIDELPQLFNVLFGDMSLVGPRPPLPEEVERYTIEDRKRLDVKPGLTCTWQVSGRSALPFKKQVALDKEYIRSWSLKQDLLILLKTIPAIFSGRGAY